MDRNDISLARAAFNQFDDLRLDVAIGRLTPTDANAIANKRALADFRDAEDAQRVSEIAARVRARFGGNVATKGKGYKTVGARNHGKAAVQVRGAGLGRYGAERLLPADNAVAREGKSNHRQA
jgi:hypothetical protein